MKIPKVGASKALRFGGDSDGDDGEVVPVTALLTEDSQELLAEDNDNLLTE